MDKHQLRELLVRSLEKEMPPYQWCKMPFGYVKIKITDWAQWMNLPIPVYPPRPSLEDQVFALLKSNGAKCLRCYPATAAVALIDSDQRQPFYSVGQPHNPDYEQAVCYRHYKSWSLYKQRREVIEATKHHGLQVKWGEYATNNLSIVVIRPEHLADYILDNRR